MSEFVDVTDFMDSQRISWFQIKVVLACLLIQYFDGFDWLVIAYVGPSLTNEWHISRTSSGAVFGVGVFGVAIGTLVIGPVADIIGRRWLTIGAVAFFGFWSVMTAFATAPGQDHAVAFHYRFGTWSPPYRAALCWSPNTHRAAAAPPWSWLPPAGLLSARPPAV